MRSYSIFTIVLLCVMILVVDIFAFYWLQSITQQISSENLKFTIHGIFWVFTIGLITSILYLKIRLDDIDPSRKHVLVSSLYGLTVSSFIPKLLFVIIISILYFTNYIISEQASLFLVPLVGLLSGFLPFFVILYGIFVSKYRFKIHRINVPIHNLPGNFDDLRIVQISDIHLGSFNFRYHIIEKAIKIINQLKPDIILITGDLVNNFGWELKGWDVIFQNLEAHLGKYAVLGNHDYGDYKEWETVDAKEENFNEIKDFYQKIGFNLLLNEADILERNNEKMAVIGVENWGNPPFKQYGDLQKSMMNAQEIDCKILLSHDPTHWKEEVLQKTSISLTLSGHTHGMQAAMGYKNKQWSPIKYKYEHWAGLYQESNQYLYVNRGLGWLGFPGRIGMRPEITLLKLHKS